MNGVPMMGGGDWVMLCMMLLLAVVLICLVVALLVGGYSAGFSGTKVTSAPGPPADVVTEDPGEIPAPL
jgi:hypothetical protein